ncbi:aminoglycoside phosphotransferase [Sedimentitalea sp. CY04]|uniref:Aminoglycoside phosphotransferase n=1 Tax=Parasedimentitalea denitrificans TaxID=2211118 RepID=A0ABX0W3G1_9RHOB|nr:aminoglycoside phosphotransferase family protein [Sedimentitalea sp. CY04]NIZ59976.1 aminoglycoside phosphotransferase [Sedimentitalea sp. CY04]
MSTNEEQILSGGNINTVVRVGDTVRRSTRPQSATIHDYLCHLERKNVPAPRFLGIDENQREILSFIEGETEFPSDMWDNVDALTESATLLRKLHDVSVGFATLDPANWVYRHPDTERREVICHNDFAPYNMVFRNGVPVSILDFELCGPGPRVRDLAYLAYWMVPLSFAPGELHEASEKDANSNSPRLRLLCRTYGGQSPQDVLMMVSKVLHHMSDETAITKMVGAEAAGRLIAEGHLDHWRQEAEAFDKRVEGLLGNVV